ncbi:MAG: phage terminase large subunit family protein [Planctomycetes bacterium]|nr:phage terminase large subunit family protein [Planctomycetota bacterium]
MAVATQTPAQRGQYQKHRERARNRSAAITLVGQEIGAIPPIRDLSRRRRADADFRFFCETYFPQVFSLAWSEDHLRVIAKIERVVLDGETLAVAMPRGSGKTSLCLAAVLWGILTGGHKFVMLIAGSEELALRLLSNVKAHLMSNDALLGDYPEALYPIRRLEGETRRAAGQRYYGVLTRIGWGADELVMPTIPGSPSSGAIIRVSGLEGNIRGAVYVRYDGLAVRPTLAVCDDPQTDASAKSAIQTGDRLSIIGGAVGGLAGPGKRTAVIIPCTVIRQGDLADQLLDRSHNPEYQGERTKLLYSFPKNETLWAEYKEVRSAGILAGDGGKAGNEFYADRREKMDEGAVSGWPARFNVTELSAVQHAMNLLHKDEATFWSEYQNEPQATEDAVALLTADDIQTRLNGLKAGVVPLNADYLTMFVDVQKELLFYVVAAWESNFTGYVIDYGTWPEQKRSHFSLRDAQRTLQKVSKSRALEAQLAEGLDKLLNAKVGHEWTREDGAVMRIGLALVDANWAQSTDVVYQVCRRSAYAAVLMPSHGQFVGGANKPWSETARKKGERQGLHWRIPASRGPRAVRHVLIDTNFWKSCIHQRFATPVGDRGSLSLWGRSGSVHRLFAEHMTAEYRVRVEARGRVVDEWKARVGKPDNHWFDGMVGCATAAAILGAVLLERLPRGGKSGESKSGDEVKRRPKRQKVRYL